MADGMEKTEENKNIVDELTKYVSTFVDDLDENSTESNLTIIDSEYSEYSSLNYDKEEKYRDYAFSLDDGIKSCKCLPSCSSIHYDAEVSQTHLNWMQYAKARKTYVPQNDEY